MPAPSQASVLLTGATGYIGGRLLRRMTDAGHEIRALARRPEHIRMRAPNLRVIQGDLLDPSTLAPAMEGVGTAYYLVHSMSSTGAYMEIDRKAASHFAEAARLYRLRRIIYLGGLAQTTPDIPLSKHMASRHEVGEILRTSGVPVTELRASIVIGSGSLSFELIRALVERLPVMITPRWVDIMAQPIGIEDLLNYLMLAADQTGDANRIYEIGGADQVSYGGLMREYARQRGLRRWMLPVPLLTPHLSSLWLGLVTPIYARVGKALISSIRNASVVNDTSALHYFPLRPSGLSEIISQALRNEDRDYAETRWSSALSSLGTLPHPPGNGMGTRIVDSRTRRVPVPPDVAFAPIQSIGGSNRWYYANFLWQIRGWLDLMAGGAGLRRGRRHPVELAPGDTLDWWRVEAIEPGRRLRLYAEMKVPGRAWLEFEVTPHASGSEIRQTALFDPAGLGGRLYWYALYPVHVLIFAGMLRAIARRAVTAHSASRSARQS